MKYLLVAFALLVLTGSVSSQTKTAMPMTSGQPTFAALTMDGTQVDTAALRGKVVVLNLWFVNCPNCVEEIKILNQLVDEYRDNKDVVFLGLAASSKPELEKFLKKYPFKYQVVPNAMMIILGKFGTPDKKGDINVSFPMHYVLDREGRVAAKAQGIKGIEVVKTELKNQFPAKSMGSN